MLNNSCFENEDYKAIIFKGKDFEIFNAKAKKPFCPKIKKYGNSFLLDFESLPIVSIEDTNKVVEGVTKAQKFIKEIKKNKN